MSHVFSIVRSSVLLLASVFLASSPAWVRTLCGQGAPDRAAADVSPNSNDDAKVQWLSENALSIRSIDPVDDDFADLKPLKEILGNVRIVMLGEATHGDGATFYAKQRLIRFLHEAMGFDILAWEARFFRMEAMNRELESGQPVWIDSTWEEAGVMRPVYQYSRATLKTDRPIRHTGVDFVFGFPKARGIDDYRKHLFDFFGEEAPGLAFPADCRTIAELLEALKGVHKPSGRERVKWQSAIGRVLSSLRKSDSTAQNRREIEYFAKTLENLASYEQHLSLQNDPGWKHLFFRSRKLGENLTWLTKEWYPNKKIIVWAANRHVARNVSSIEIAIPGMPGRRFPPDYKEMGDFIYRELGDSVYSIGFSTYQGRRGRRQVEPESVEPVPGSIETLWHHTGYGYGFLDFRSLPGDHWLRKPFLAHFDQVTERTTWPDVFDGMFYIDTMFPNTESGAVPVGVRTKSR